GALPHRDGMSGVQTHMTNTLNTPIEALEVAYPFRVEAYHLRPETGGEGRFRGGQGIVRSIRFLGERGTVSLITERRRFPPRGLRGGADGARGANSLLRDGERLPLPSKTTMGLRRDDVIVVETPGGGGWGRPE
ncbi:MAG: hydantoinase B/oxoprolinase family protein, partial [Thermoplasmata archaeon]|nr:hydantoinase B/oxoprolinase family protein [Thermoplasmata archaeon]